METEHDSREEEKGREAGWKGDGEKKLGKSVSSGLDIEIYAAIAELTDEDWTARDGPSVGEKRGGIQNLRISRGNEHDVAHDRAVAARISSRRLLGSAE